MADNDCPESQSTTDLKPREPIWVPEHGLTLLFEPASSNATVADVVFVHGLQGHPYKTWLYKGKVEKKVHNEVGSFHSLLCRFLFFNSRYDRLVKARLDAINNRLVKARLDSINERSVIFF